MEESRHLRAMRRILFVIMAATILGTATELVLLEHTESTVQWIPLIAFGVISLAMVAVVIRETRGPLLIFRLVMAGTVLTGAAGLYFHFKGNVEFARETYPDLAGYELFKEAIMGATPTLAPGSMVQLGLIGLAFTFRHPALRKAAGPDVTASHKTTTYGDSK